MTMLPGPGRPGDYSPGLPQIRTCAINASGSSVMESQIRFASRECFVNPKSWYDAPAGCPTHDSMTAISLPSTGSPRFRFPGFLGTTKMCDFLPPSRRASLPSLGATRRCVPSFCSSGPRTRDPRPGVQLRSPLPDLIRLEMVRTSQVPGGPSCLYAVFSDPGWTDATGHPNVVGSASAASTAKAPATDSFGAL